MRKIAVLMAALGLAAVLNGCGSGLTQSQQVPPEIVYIVPT